MNTLINAIDGGTVGAGIVVFLIIIIGLTIALMIAEGFLVTKGNVKILINEDQDAALEVESGSTLLDTLSNAGIQLPSACGGGGTCGVCVCKVISGGGDVLPTEKSHLSLKEQQEGLRLACQLKVKEDLEIEVEPEIFSIKKWECEVVSNENVATFIKEFIVELPPGETIDYRAGGYIQIEIPGYKDLKYSNFDIEEQYRGDWDHFKIFDNVANNPEPVVRAYSMASYPAEGNRLMLNVRIASPPPRLPNVPPGIASSYIFDCKKGDKVTISGPFGEFFMKDSDREIMFIGGGAGMAPMRSHIFDLFHTKKSGRKATFWYGARSKREMFYDDHFKKIEADFPNFKYYVGLSDPQAEDNWQIKKNLEDTEADGYTGFIHQVILENYLNNHEAPEEIEYYLCGPPMMNDAIQDMLFNLGVEKEMIAFDDFGS
ncbi:NADH:ubiquinone reductase (Na(+)-transporting) subunit F [Lentisphaera profundi]|uniref:Na(+)-translocating NADH-quinone reductase subunit F n=1 Tax=Lentisphaera profundi TaxID=1658616 RepID=A0ABY7VX86_9BACT|nr:NADH:ubiquinone reductase (Na(+)-transporting) subunit F [Lentisphaera profundi]WDE98838.1 NADH:ubiquinone reductase (Na(+)-transporting) subunit F [Lentisphaera profundi]